MLAESFLVWKYETVAPGIDGDEANHLNLGAASNIFATIFRRFAHDDEVWPSVVELIVSHEEAYLEHCRRFALAQAA